MKVLIVTSVTALGLYRYATYGLAGIVPPIPGTRRILGARVAAARDRRMTTSY